jgi:hypothetical protein
VIVPSEITETDDELEFATNISPLAGSYVTYLGLVPLGVGTKFTVNAGTEFLAA